MYFDQSFSDGQFKKTVSNDNLLKIFPDTNFTDINEGLVNTIYWFIKNYNTLRK